MHRVVFVAEEAGRRALRAMALQQTDDFRVALPERPRNRRVAVNFSMTDIGSLSEQKLSESDVILLTGHHQRRYTRFIVCVVKRRTVAEQQFAERQASGMGRGMKRRKAARVARHNVGTLTYQQLGMARWPARAAFMRGVAWSRVRLSTSVPAASK